jgi:hypothetical protein
MPAKSVFYEFNGFLLRSPAAGAEPAFTHHYEMGAGTHL